MFLFLIYEGSAVKTMMSWIHATASWDLFLYEAKQLPVNIMQETTGDSWELPLRRSQMAQRLRYWGVFWFWPKLDSFFCFPFECITRKAFDSHRLKMVKNAQFKKGFPSFYSFLLTNVCESYALIVFRVIVSYSIQCTFIILINLSIISLWHPSLYSVIIAHLSALLSGWLLFFPHIRENMRLFSFCICSFHLTNSPRVPSILLRVTRVQPSLFNIQNTG